MNEKNMENFSYSFIYKILYRYGNIPATIILSAYLISSASNLNYSLIYLFPFVITALLIYLINKQYLTMYKILAYKISADYVKLTCTNFLFSKRKIVIYYSDIETLEGGIFDGKYNGLVKVWDGKSKMCIGFFSKIKNAKQLEKLILLNVNEAVYKQAMSKAKIDLKDLKSTKETNHTD
ncbi:MAG: hypothetical protein ACYCVH_11915 [Ignavibacteriaceae bacterium]